MSRQDANAAFARTSFLYGGNAGYIEDLYARYEADPKAVDAAWRSFFENLKDDRADVERNARSPSWRRPDWPLPERNALTGATEDWQQAGAAITGKLQAQAHARGVEVTAAEIERATRDSIRAHTVSARAISIAGFFSTMCSGSNSAPSARSSLSCGGPIARRLALNSSTFPAPRRRAGSRSASRDRTRRLRSPAKASAPSSTSWSRPKASKNSAT